MNNQKNIKIVSLVLQLKIVSYSLKKFNFGLILKIPGLGLHKKKLNPNTKNSSRKNILLYLFVNILIVVSLCKVSFRNKILVLETLNPNPNPKQIT